MLEKMKANLSKDAMVGFKQVLYSLFHKIYLQHCLQEVWLEIACMHFCSITVLQILLPYNKGILHLPTPRIIKDCELVHTHGIFTFPGSELMLRLGEKRKIHQFESRDRCFNCAGCYSVNCAICTRYNSFLSLDLLLQLVIFFGFLLAIIRCARHLNFLFFGTQT